METLRIGSFRARYHLPPTERAAAGRLDRLLADMLDERLEAALEAAGVDAREEVCLRRVDAPVRVRLAAADAVVAEAWSRAVAAAIGAAIERGGPGVVRYGSRRHALLDVVLAVARGDVARAWAWRRLELWPGAEVDPASAQDSARAAVDALRRDPPAIAPVLAAAARTDALALARPLAAAGLERAALAEAVARTRAPRGAHTAGIGGVTGLPAADLAAAGSAPAAALAAAAARALADTRAADGDEAGAVALAFLVALVDHPAPRGAPAFAPRIDGVARTLLTATRSAGRGASGIAAAARDDVDDAAAARAADRAGAPAAPALDEGATPGAAGEIEPEREDAPPPQRASGRTRAGGLLYLVNVVGELGLVDDLPPERPLRWSLHALALLLAPIERDDPAALAFCGLPPDAEPPDERTRPPAPAELALLEDAGRRIAGRTAEVLRVYGEPDGVLGSLVAREAEIVADPGWIDVRLRLEDVSTELRRSGLDLDPGWLPWLGCVVRFLYG
jgi:hypothetical protein